MRCLVGGGTGPAYAIRVSTEPAVTQEREVARDLPAASGKLHYTKVELELNLAGEGPGDFWLIATYRDDWSCEWQSRRTMGVDWGPQPRVQGTSELTRRIITFPPKYLASPAD